MRTKRPLLVMAVFLIGLGVFILWGASLLLQTAVPAGLLRAVPGLFAAGFGFYFIYRIVRHFRSIRNLVQRTKKENMPLGKLTDTDVHILQQELLAVKKWMRRNIVFGMLFIVMACFVTGKFPGLHSFIRSLEEGGEYGLLVQKPAGVVLFILVIAIETFLLYNAITDTKNIGADLRELQKIKLRGKIKGIQTERFNQHKGTVVIYVGGIELEREIDPVNEPRLQTNTEVEIDLAIHSQTILSIVPVTNASGHYR